MKKHSIITASFLSLLVSSSLFSASPYPGNQGSYGNQSTYGNQRNTSVQSDPYNTSTQNSYGNQSTYGNQSSTSTSDNSNSTSMQPNYQTTITETKYSANDELAHRIRIVLQNDPSIGMNASGIDIEAEDGIVTLTGTIKDDAEKAKVESIVKRIPGVKSVSNKLTISL